MPVRKDGICTGKCKAPYGAQCLPSVHNNLKRPVPLAAEFFTTQDRHSAGARDEARWLAWHEGIADAPPVPDAVACLRHRNIQTLNDAVEVELL